MPRISLFLGVSAVFLAVLVVSVRSHGSEHPNDAFLGPSDDWIHAGEHPGSFLDSHGRVRIFHGVSAVRKAFPWYWEDFVHNLGTVEQLHQWGINAVRLGWMWSGVQPAAGVFNASYVAIIDGIVENLARRGIHTLLDMHQDGASSLFCLYDGLPLWVVEKRSPPKHAFPWPLSGNCSRPWESNFVAEAMESTYQDLYDNHNGMQDDFVKFWQFSAAHFANNSHVLAYELINEPWAGNAYEDPLIMLPALAGQKNLMPLYNRTAAAIRAVDNRHMIAVEPVTWGMFLHGDYIGSGLTTPGGTLYRNRTMFSWHYYCPTYHFMDPSANTNVTRFLCDDLIDKSVFDSIQYDIDATGGASMLTEWGECDPSYEAGAIECDAVQSKCDEHLMSWSWWDYAGHEQNSNATAYGKMLARTYAQATAGTPEVMSFNRTTGAFHFCYTMGTPPSADPIAVTTEIYHSPTLHYPSGAVVTTTPNVAAKVNGTAILVTPTASGGPGQRACVNVTRASQ